MEIIYPGIKCTWVQPSISPPSRSVITRAEKTRFRLLSVCSGKAHSETRSQLMLIGYTESPTCDLRQAEGQKTDKQNKEKMSVNQSMYPCAGGFASWIKYRGSLSLLLPRRNTPTCILRPCSQVNHGNHMATIIISAFPAITDSHTAPQPPTIK